MINKNNSLVKQAKKHLVGGVNSPVRSYNYVSSNPLLIRRARGSKVYDYEKRSYIDYVLSYGAIILGHGHPAVTSSIRRALGSGLSFGATNLAEVKLAEVIKKAIPTLDKIRFVNSGTEALMSAVRLARGYTTRNKIIKFTHSYHGHADFFLAKGGSGLATLQIPLSEGVPDEFIRNTIVLDYGDKNALEDIFKKYSRQIAAVILEPVGGNFGVVPPNIEFLKYLRGLTKEDGSLLIFDEVITGFRFKFGSISDILKIKPDLICLGKIIGGGLPIGAYGGPNKIMQKLSPLGKVYQASTFAGNPIVMNAGLATLKVLYSLREKYNILDKGAGYLRQVLQEFSEYRGICLKVSNYGSMFSLKFKKKKDFRDFFLKMLKKGVHLVPSEYETNFLSFAHTDRDITKTARAIKSFFKNM